MRSLIGQINQQTSAEANELTIEDDVRTCFLSSRALRVRARIFVEPLDGAPQVALTPAASAAAATVAAATATTFDSLLARQALKQRT